MKKIVALLALASSSFVFAQTEAEYLEEQGFTHSKTVKSFNINGKTVKLKYGVNGGSFCAGSFYFDNNGKRTESFGCTEDPSAAKVKQTGNKITVKLESCTRGFGSNEYECTSETYIYQNGKVQGN